MGLILRKTIIFFGLLHLSLISLCLSLFVAHPTPLNFCLIFLMIYFFPILVFRIQNYIIPLKEGKFDLREPHFNAWWSAHQIQQVFNAIPFLEGILRIIPGAYSFWLRLWGAKIGKQVYWTPGIDLIDRSLLEIDDFVIFGHLSKCSSHIISEKNGVMVLYIKKIKLGKSVMVGAGTVLGPGTVVADKINIPAGTILLIDQHVENQQQLQTIHHDPIQRPPTSTF